MVDNPDNPENPNKPEDLDELGEDTDSEDSGGVGEIEDSEDSEGSGGVGEIEDSGEVGGFGDFTEEPIEELDPLEEASRLVETAEMAFRLEWRWAFFELYVITPVIPEINPPVIIPPEPLADGVGVEFVYPIHDYGYRMSTSKGEDSVMMGMSMCKLYYTIEKIIYLLIDRLKSGGIDTQTEVQVAFAGFMLAQRKAFESIINLSYNVVVTNFEPGEWGERYLQTVKRLADKGYGYPPESPRDIFRHEQSGSPMRKS